MLDKKDESCGTCRFFNGDEKGPNGTCLRHPPAAPNAAPVTHADCWCGEYALNSHLPKEETEKTGWKKLFSLLLIFIAVTATAATTYKASYLLTQGPFYSTNIVNNVRGATALGGIMVSNSVLPNTTNNAMWSTLLTIPYHRSFFLMLTANSFTNTFSTNYYFLYPAPDGVNVDTNHPVWASGPVTCSPNGLMITNLPSTVIGDCGFFQLGIGNQGTNTSTNVNAQAFFKDETVWVATP